MRKIQMTGEVVLALAIVLWWTVPVFALGRYEVTVSTTVGCTVANVNNYILINDGPSDVHWECDTETIATAGKAALKSSDGPITVYEGCLKICYKTASGSSTLRIITSER